MAVTSIAPWFGGKRSLAPEIVREIGTHRSWWEPFFEPVPEWELWPDNLGPARGDYILSENPLRLERSFAGVGLVLTLGETVAPELAE